MRRRQSRRNPGEQDDGVVKQVNDSWVELMAADGRRQRVATADIATQRTSAISLMPDELHAGLTVEEFSDLIEYLTTLKQPENALTSNRGMPAVIPELEKPVVLRPFFGEELRFPHAFVHKPGDVRSGLVWFGQIPGLTNNFLAVHQTGKVWLLDKDRNKNRCSAISQRSCSTSAGPTACSAWRFIQSSGRTISIT
jgi:hypothetical protein